MAKATKAGERQPFSDAKLVGKVVVVTRDYQKAFKTKEGHNDRSTRVSPHKQPDEIKAFSGLGTESAVDNKVEHEHSL